MTQNFKINTWTCKCAQSRGCSFPDHVDLLHAVSSQILSAGLSLFDLQQRNNIILWNHFTMCYKWTSSPPLTMNLLSPSLSVQSLQKAMWWLVYLFFFWSSSIWFELVFFEAGNFKTKGTSLLPRRHNKRVTLSLWFWSLQQERWSVWILWRCIRVKHERYDDGGRGFDDGALWKEKLKETNLSWYVDNKVDV